MKIRFELPETDILIIVSSITTPSESAILWFLRAYTIEHGHGASKEEVLLMSGVSQRTFHRAWATLEKAGLVRIEYALTESGRSLPNKSVAID